MLSSISRYLFIYTLLILISEHTLWSAVAGGRGLWTIWSVMSITARQLTSGGQHSPHLRSRGRGVLPGPVIRKQCVIILLSYSCHTHVMASYSQPSPAPPTLHSAYCHDDNHRNGSSVWTPVDILLTHSNTAAGEQGEASERVEAEQPHN